MFVRFIKAYQVKRRRQLLEKNLCSIPNCFCLTASRAGQPAEEAAEGPEPPDSNEPDQRRSRWEQGERQISFTGAHVRRSHRTCWRLQIKLQQVDLIAELKKRQVSPQVREGKDGAIEDIITGNTPTATPQVA